MKHNNFLHAASETQRVFVGRNKPLHIWKQVMDELIEKGYTIVSVSIQDSGDGVLVIEYMHLTEELVAWIIKWLGCNDMDIITEPKPYAGVAEQYKLDESLEVQENAYYKSQAEFVGTDEIIKSPPYELEPEATCCGPHGCNTNSDKCPEPEDYVE